MEKQTIQSSRGEAKEKRNNPSFCYEDNDFMKFKNSNIFAYLFFMLLYAVLIYYGFTIILINYIKSVDVLYKILIILSIILATIFVILTIYSYRNGKFAFLYYITKVLLGAIVGNIGIIWFLTKTFYLTYIEILNLFVYMVLVSVVVSIIAWLLTRLMIKVRCRE